MWKAILKNQFSIFFFRNKGRVAIIDAIKVTEKSSKIKKLPNNQDYAMILKDYSQFKMESNSGFINIYDLNYDDSHISTIEVGNNKILNLESYRIEPEVLIKHGYITDDRYSKAQDSDNFNFRSQELNLEDFPSSCSGGSDNNVSWGECYDCLTSICGDSDCQETLDLTNVFSLYNGFPPLGDLAIGAACVYISAAN